MSRTLSRVLLSLVLALLVGFSTAFAQDADKKKKDGPKKPRKTAEEIFKAKDKNNDGKLSFDEFKGKAKDADVIERIEKRFKALDKNGDKSICAVEWKAKPERKKKPEKKPAKKPAEKK